MTYVLPNEKLYPISKGEDIRLALDAYSMVGGMPYHDFIWRLYEIAKENGYESYIPNKVKQQLGLRPENTAERPEFKQKNKKIKRERPQKWYEEEN